MGALDEFKARLGLGGDPAPTPQATSPLADFRARLAAGGVDASTVQRATDALESRRAQFAEDHPALYDHMSHAFGVTAGGPVGAPGSISGKVADALVGKPVDPAYAASAAGAVAARDNGPPPAISFGGPPRANATTVPATQSPLYPNLAPKPAGGGGYGGGDPWAAMRGKLDSDQARVLGTYDTEKDQTMGLGGLIQEREAATGQARQLLAAKQVRDAELAQQEADDARARFDDYTSKTDALNAQLAERKVDPGRLMANLDMGSKAGIMIGGIAGGILSALNGGRNGVVDQLTKMIDDDVQQQYGDIARSRESVRERNTLLGQYMQIHGNAELAKLQARSAMYAATKDAILGRAEELGSREAMQNAMLAAGQVDRKQAELQQAIDANKLAVAQQQAAAAAAAARAAEEKIWSRQMELAKLGLEKDKLSIEAAKIKGEGDDKVNAEVQHLADKLGSKELANNRALAENLYTRMRGADGKIDTTKGLPGVGASADMRERVAPPVSMLSAKDLILRGGPATAALANKAIGLDDTERVGRQDWARAVLAYQDAVTGAGATDKEREMLTRAFQGAKTPAEQANAVNQLREFYAQQEARTMAGASPRAQAVFKQRLESIAPSMPTTVQTKK